MFKRWFRKNWIKFAVVLIILIAIASIFWFNRSAKILPNGYTKAHAAAFFQGLTLNKDLPKTETMTIDGQQWFVMEKNASAMLLMEPKTGRIDIKEIGNGGTLWSSTPSQTELAKETIKGTWRKNLESPFILNYLRDETTIERIANTVSNPTVVAWRKIKDGVGIQYTMTELGIQIYLEYTLDDKGFRVHLPELGVLENQNNKITSIELLPFFGAAMDDRQGYMLVPDGPGGLIDFNKTRIPGLVPYEFPVYGDDYSVPVDDFYSNRSDIAYPVFGMNRGDSGFIAIIEQGQYKADIIAAPAGTLTSFNHATARFQLRRLYFRPRTLTSYVKTFESDIVMDADTIRYIFLPHDRTDYVSMGTTYRDYLMKEQGIKKLSRQAGAPPLFVKFVLGATETTPTGSRVVTATTLDQAGKIADDLFQQGIKNLRVGLLGWQNDGFPGKIPNRFPVNAAVGGDSGLIKLQQNLQHKGIPLILDDDLLEAAERRGNNFSTILSAARMINGLPLKYEQNGDWYGKVVYFDAISPKVMYDRYLPEALKGYKKLQVSGVEADNLGNGVYSDFHNSHPLDRKTTASIFVKTLDDIKNTIGFVSTSGAFSYVLGHADHLFGLPVSTNYDFIVDHTVPFYPIAVHGLITYSTDPGNQRLEPQKDFLRDIEYGSIPVFSITHENPGIMQNTNFGFLFNSQYSVLRQNIIDEYDQFVKADTGVWSSFIIGHRQVTDKVFETSYENGRKVWVNYNGTAVTAEGQTVDGMSFKVVAEGANP